MKPGEYKFKVGERVVVKVNRLYRDFSSPKKGDVVTIYGFSGDYYGPYNIIDYNGRIFRNWNTKQLQKMGKELL